jgi:hypothetical protein
VAGTALKWYRSEGLCCLCPRPPVLRGGQGKELDSCPLT